MSDRARQIAIDERIETMDELTEEAKQTARASRGSEWYLDEKLSTGEITLQQKDPASLPRYIPIRMWIFTMKHVAMGHMGYEIVVWNRSRFISIEMQ